MNGIFKNEITNKAIIRMVKLGKISAGIFILLLEL
jgi:hypothetical protein